MYMETGSYSYTYVRPMLFIVHIQYNEILHISDMDKYGKAGKGLVKGKARKGRQG
jgi:hypothetical protein